MVKLTLLKPKDKDGHPWQCTFCKKEGSSEKSICDKCLKRIASISSPNATKEDGLIYSALTTSTKRKRQQIIQKYAEEVTVEKDQNVKRL